MDNFENLNPQQHEAVTAGNGQILVIAGPGSGKKSRDKQSDDDYTPLFGG